MIIRRPKRSLNVPAAAGKLRPGKGFIYAMRELSQRDMTPPEESAEDEAETVKNALLRFLESKKVQIYPDPTLDGLDLLCKKAREKIKTLRGKEMEPAL